MLFSSFVEMVLLDFRNQTVRSLLHNESWLIPLVDHDYFWLSSDPRRRLDIELSKNQNTVRTAETLHINWIP